MHSILCIAALPLALASAGLSPRALLLLPRQGGDAFIPGAGPTVTDCPAPCGDSECLDVPRGDTCCAEGYGCPGGSFCLTQGYCCPNGDDPSNCASQFGVTLPPGFTPGNTVPAGAASSAAPTASPSQPPVVTGSQSPVSQPPVYTSSVAKVSTGQTGHPVIGTGTASAPYVTSTGVPSNIVPFTGGASVLRFAISGGVVGVVVGSIGLLLL